ncbi:hypothetical protein HYX02_04245 [Candidatus Woesearchaeota archaeon]|nr:hypothetical protein [Candidatus Woesearchaeota archaeon]
MYTDALSNAVRRLNYMTKEELAKEGIALGDKVNAQAVWDYANKLAEKALAGVNFDPKDPRFRNNYNEIRSIVKQFASTPDLVEALLASYIRTSTSYIDEKVVLPFQATKTGESKPQLHLVATAAGVEDEFRKVIDDINEPTDAGTVAGQIAPQLRERVFRGVATSTIGGLEKKVIPKM